MINSLRTKETQNRYDNDRANGLVKNLWDVPVVYETKSFRIISNSYPYDKISEEHVMLLPKLSFFKSVLFLIKNYKKIKTSVAFILAQKFSEVHGHKQVIWNTPKEQSVKDIIHVHILK